MPHALETTRQENKGEQKLVPLAPFIAVIAATPAFIFGLVATLSWQECLFVVLAAVALAVGAVFTVLEIQRLGRATKLVR